MSWEAFSSTDFRIRRLIGRLRSIEIDYQIAKANREAKGNVKPSRSEATFSKVIRGYISQARAIERRHNREYPKYQVNIFEELVGLDENLVYTKQQLGKQVIQNKRTREAKKRNIDSVLHGREQLAVVTELQVEQMKQESEDWHKNKKSILDSVNEDVMKIIYSQKNGEKK